MAHSAPAGCAGCQVWYNNLRCTNGERVQLDADSTNGYGPETMTFNEVASGEYSYMVNKFTATSPVALKDSQAVVQEQRLVSFMPPCLSSLHPRSRTPPSHATRPTRPTYRPLPALDSASVRGG